MTDDKTKGNGNSKSMKRSQKITIIRIFTILVKHSVLFGFSFLLAGMVIFTFMWLYIPHFLNYKIEIEAPDLIGKTVEEARKISRNINSELLADSTSYNSNYQENTIFHQYPVRGTKIKPGRSIRVIVSLGARPITMPNVVGNPRRDAELEVKRYGLKLVKPQWVNSNDYLKGIIARQSPEGGEEIPENTEVILYISDGSPETDVVMPNLIELGLSAALDTLKAYGFNLSNVHQQTEEAPELLPETVIDQHPDPGKETNKNTEINLIISTSK